uniref:Fatty acid desaturase domain-containing protein n=1 Tax=Brassica oleracea var. oleracea TaxID=109376 RepID=A0A0D3CHI9_BRAOL
MASLCTALKPLSPFSSFVKQGYSMNTSALFTYHTSNYTHSFRPKRRGALAVHNNAPDPVESSWRAPLSEDVKGRQKSAFWKRTWNSTDVRNVVIMEKSIWILHLLLYRSLSISISVSILHLRFSISASILHLRLDSPSLILHLLLDSPSPPRFSITLLHRRFSQLRFNSCSTSLRFQLWFEHSIMDKAWVHLNSEHLQYLQDTDGRSRRDASTLWSMHTKNFASWLKEKVLSDSYKERRSKQIPHTYSRKGMVRLAEEMGDPIEWVSNHRYHHKHRDTQRDPHSPIQGFWFSHITWISDFGSIQKKCGGEENVNDLVRQPFYRFLQRTLYLRLIAFGFLLHIWGGMPFLVWGMAWTRVVAARRYLVHYKKTATYRRKKSSVCRRNNVIPTTYRRNKSSEITLWKFIFPWKSLGNFRRNSEETNFRGNSEDHQFVEKLLGIYRGRTSSGYFDGLSDGPIL